MPEIQPIKLAIVGCGAITASAHLPAALRSPWIDLHALVDVSLDNAQALARKHALICRVCADLSEVIAEVEGVLIATPNHTHLAIAETALRRGVPTLIEKPLATTYDDAVRMCELAEQGGAFISVGYRSRHWPAVRFSSASSTSTIWAASTASITSWATRAAGTRSPATACGAARLAAGR